MSDAQVRFLEIAEIATQRERRAEDYFEFLRVPAMSAGRTGVSTRRAPQIRRPILSDYCAAAGAAGAAGVAGVADPAAGRCSPKKRSISCIIVTLSFISLNE